MALPNYNNIKDRNSTPHNLQLQHFDFITGQIQKENRLLKGLVAVFAFIAVLSFGAVFYAINLPATVPVLVTMNDFGETNYLGPVNDPNYTVPEIAIVNQVKDFLSNLFGLSTDRQVVNKNIDKVYAMTTSVTANKYTNYVKENQLLQEFGKVTRDVFFQTEPLVVSASSFQVDFTVVTKTLEGKNLKSENFRALLSVNVFTPDENDINTNPLGIYITSFDIKPIN